MNTELREAIAQKGNTIASLENNFWYMEADQKANHPYAVFSFFTNNEERDSVDKFPEYYLQINIYDTDPERIEIVKESITESFTDSESDFNLPGYEFDSIDFITARPQKIDKVFQISIEYKIELTKK